MSYIIGDKFIFILNDIHLPPAKTISAAQSKSKSVSCRADCNIESSLFGNSCFRRGMCIDILMSDIWKNNFHIIALSWLCVYIYHLQIAYYPCHYALLLLLDYKNGHFLFFPSHTAMYCIFFFFLVIKWYSHTEIFLL